MPPKEQEFDLAHHGDEVIVTAADGSSGVTIKVKIQTGHSEHRAHLLSFQTQSQAERLFPIIMKGLRA